MPGDDKACGAGSQVGVGQQPRHGHTPTVHLFFWTVISLMRHFISSLIVAVLLDNLGQASGVSVFTELQKNWLRFERKIQGLKPLVARKLPSSPLRRKALILAESTAFDNFFLGIILLNTALMAVSFRSLAYPNLALCDVPFPLYAGDCDPEPFGSLLWTWNESTMIESTMMVKSITECVGILDLADGPLPPVRGVFARCQGPQHHLHVPLLPRNRLSALCALMEVGCFFFFLCFVLDVLTT
eukprot:373282-Rhodomonas_salina.2